jgi:hypothetical protein
MMLAKLPWWTECVLEIVDIGQHSIWGRIRDRKNLSIIRIEGFFDLNEPWIIMPMVCMSNQN